MWPSRVICLLCYEINICNSDTNKIVLLSLFIPFISLIFTHFPSFIPIILEQLPQTL